MQLLYFTIIVIITKDKPNITVKDLSVRSLPNSHNLDLAIAQSIPHIHLPVVRQ